METTENVYVLTEKNAERAERARQALETYKRSLGEGGDADCDTARDLMQDIMHWEAKRRMEDVYNEAVGAQPVPGPVDYEQVRDGVQEWFQAAYNDFQNEARGESEDEIGPCVTCGTQCYPDADGGSVICPKCKETEDL